MTHTHHGIDYVEIPAPAEGEVLVAVEVAGLSYGDVIVRSGRYPFPLPYVPGLEVGGRVVAAGPGTDPALVGARVVAATVGMSGGYAEFAVSEAVNAHRVPEALGLDTAVAVAQSGALAIGMLAVLPSLSSAPPAGAAELISINSNGGGTHVLDAVRPYDWDLDIDAASAPADGELTITLRGEGHGVELSTVVRSCTTRWEGSGCPGTATTLGTAAPLRLDGAEKPLLRQPTPSVVHLRVSVTGGGDPSGAATLILRATAEQTSVEQTVGTTVLPATGGPSPALLAAPAAVLVGLGVALIARHRHRRRGR